ncbi:MAG: hypothetical protein IJT51_06355 [Bacteroidales bacterium]|nr:hypothetical protein [Bacteroidales bacterium]
MHEKRIIGICLLLSCWIVLQAGNTTRSDSTSTSIGRTGWFTYAPYGKSLLSDLHPNFVRFEIVWNKNHTVYDFSHTDKSVRPSTQGCFGMDLPVWNGNFGDRQQFGLSITLSTSAYLWMDLFESKTSPVINTDYRIGMPTLTFIHRFNRKFLKNYSIAWSPFKHESTHAGDEIQIQRVEAGYAIRRVNVSYNYTELVFTLNEPEDRMVQCHTFRLGLMLLWVPKAGWYRIIESAGDGDASCAHPTLSPFEAYFQYQYQTPTSRHGFQGIISAEIRNRAVYGYDLTLKKGEADNSKSDYRRFTYNIFLGMRYNIPGYDGYFSRFALGARLYHGNCPFGQFRSIDNYSQIGISLVFQ